LIELEPRLLALYSRALAIRKRRRYFNGCWYGRGSHDGMKDKLKELVGWRRKNSAELGTCEAYDLAYDKVFYEALCGGTWKTGLR